MNANRFKFNPWGDVPPEAAPAPVRMEETAQGITLGDTSLPDIEDDGSPRPRIDIQVKGFGGIHVLSASSTTEGMVRVMDWCIAHLREIEDILTAYAVLVVKVVERPKAGFFIQKPDGWTLCVPDAATKDQALSQIIQALTSVANMTTMGASLRSAGITAYRF